MPTYRILNIEYRIKLLPTTYHQLRTAAGFSLIELLVSMALLGILSGIGISIFAIVNNSYTRANAISKMQTQGQQTMEQLERSVRSASEVEIYTSTSGQASCTTDRCLVLAIPTASIEYTLNGGCAKTVYAWTAPSYTQSAESNGKVKRYALTASDDPCGSTTVDMFDTDPQQGVSVEKKGSAEVFIKNAGTIPTVAISYNLTQGAKLKPASGTDNRASVPLKTTVSLRKY